MGNNRRKRTPSRSVAERASPAAQIGDSRAILSGITRILVKNGHSPGRLSREVQEICAGYAEPEEGFDPRNLEYVAKLPDVLADWNEDPRYVVDGKPALLPMYGPLPSMETLVHSIFPDREPEAVARSLIQMGAVRRRNRRFECRSAHVVFRGTEAYWRALVAVHAMVRTLERNLAGRTTGLEQAAISARLPLTDLKLIRETARRRGLPLLHGMDSEMRRRARHSGAGKSQTWVVVGMYETDFPARAPTKRTATLSAVRRPSRGRRASPKRSQ